MADDHDSPFPETDLDDALEHAWGAGTRREQSVVGRLERIPGVRSRVHLQEPAEEDAAPLLRVGATEGPDRPVGDERYELVGEIARGGVGIIYRGRDRDLGRDVALKVLRPEHANREFVMTRFIEEAQIGAQLQHPGIVPVYSLGLQPDGRPHFAMKLIKGRTLGALLQARRGASEDRRRFLDVFLQSCQTVSYAHARSVLHRDLKPANIMVGAFGEVLVVDWGFGKVLGRDEAKSTVSVPDATIIATVRSDSTGSQSLVGSVMGTPAYMPPEQALGHVNDLDARSDVFSLGAILCEILTGKPPYTGDPRDQLVQAAQARLGPALERLDACDADDALKALVRDCLQPVPGERPSDAGVVATAVSDWVAAADERAEQAEVDAVEEAARLERTRARLDWERRAKRKLRLGAVAVGLALVLGAVGLWLVDARRYERAEAARPGVEAAMLDAERLRGGGQLAEALGAARKAQALAHTGGVREELQARVATLVADVEQQRAAMEAEERRSSEARAFARELTAIQLGRWEGFVEHHTDVEFDQAFASRKLDPMKLEPAAFAERARTHYGDILPELAAALDAWALVRWKDAKTKRPWRPILTCARALDADPLRQRIRTALEARDGDALQAIAKEASATALPTSSLNLLATGLSTLNGHAGVEQQQGLLERALLTRPGDFWLHAYLAFPADVDDPEQQEHALDHATAAVALRPDLARAHSVVADRLKALKRYEHAYAVAQEALRLAPGDPGIHNNYGIAAYNTDRHEEAERAYRRAHELGPTLPEPLSNLGALLRTMGRNEAAIETLQRAQRRYPEYVPILVNLAGAQGRLGRYEESLETSRAAVALDESNASAWQALSGALQQLEGASAKTADEALAAGKRAVELAPKDARARGCLANALLLAGRFADAAAEARSALALDPGLGHAHAALGRVHEHHGDPQAALAAYRRAVGLDPTLVKTTCNLASTLINLGKPKEAEAIYRNLLTRWNDAEAHIGLSQALTAQGRLDAAQACLDELSPEERKRNVHTESFARAVIHDARREDEQAIAAFKRALDGRWVPTYIRLAVVLLRAQDYDEAIKVCGEANAIRETGEALNLLGLAYHRSGRFTEAVAAFKRAYPLASSEMDRGLGLLNVGLATLRLGEPAEALTFFEQALPLLKGHPQADTLGRAEIREARRKVELLALLPQVLDGSVELDSEEDFLWAWDLCWALDRREDARRVLTLAEPTLTHLHAYLCKHAQLCLASITAKDLRVPIESGEAERLRRTAAENVRRAIEAVRTGAPDAKSARAWLAFVSTDPPFEIVRGKDALARLPEAERATWEAIWKSIDEVLAVPPAAPAKPGPDKDGGK